MNPPDPTPLEVSQGMRRSILASAFASWFSVCIAQQFLNGFALVLGASEIQIALLTTLPMIGMTLQLFSTLLTQRLRRRKPYWFWISTVHRLLWLPIAGIPFLVGYYHLGSGPGMTLFLALFFVSSVLGSMVSPFWFSWMADLVPKEQTGKFWSRRMAMVSLLNLTAIPLGLFADSFPKGDLLPYALLFLLAAVVGQIDLLIHNRVVEPLPAPVADGKSLLKLAWAPFQQPDFRKFLLFGCAYTFACSFSDAFIIFFCLQRLGLSQSFIAIAVSMMWLMRWIMARYWGFLGDRFGHVPVLRVCSAALVIWPVAIAFLGPLHPIAAILAIYSYAGFFAVGFESSFIALCLRLTPASNKSLYVSTLNATIGLVAATAPLLGGGLIAWSKNHPGLLGPVDHFQLVIAMGSILRLLAVIFFPLKFQAPMGAAPGLLVRRLMDSNPFKVIHHSYVLDEGVQESERVDAVRELADAGSDIASEQLIHALRDASLEVRRGAVRALVEIGERSSLPALLEAARSPESQIQAEAVEALGRMDDRSVTPFLVSLLDDPFLHLPSMRALADLRDPASLEVIRRWGALESLPLDRRATALETWCSLGDEVAIGPCLRFIRGAQHDLPRWQAAIALAKMTAAPIDFYSALQQELRVRGEVVMAQTDLVEHSPVGRGKSPRLRKAAAALARRGQDAYMAGNWREATLGFTLASLVCLEIAPSTIADPFPPADPLLARALTPLEKTIAQLAITRSQLILSLRLAEALLKSDRSPPAPPVHEEAILAFCLLRKLLGFS